jgi:hypothetical protein
VVKHRRNGQYHHRAGLWTEKEDVWLAVVYESFRGTVGFLLLHWCFSMRLCFLGLLGLERSRALGV